MAMNGFLNGEKPSPAIQPLPPLPFCDSKDGLKVKSASIKNYDSMTDSKEGK